VAAPSVVPSLPHRLRYKLLKLTHPLPETVQTVSLGRPEQFHWG